MQTLDIFQKVDDVIETYEKKSDIYRIIAEEIKDFLETQAFEDNKLDLNITYRVKASDSLREKLVRNNYIARFGMDNALHHVQDLIGLRIECKFMEDEHRVYEALRDFFDETEDGVLFFSGSMPRIKLRMADPQPQTQKNGFSIYKVDGLYLLGREQIRFELQIKAMVNLFWSEIEHRLMYKNNSYLIADDYIRDLMSSIKKSLNMIDGQLHVLYSHYKREERPGGSSRMSTVKKLMAKMLHDVYDEKLRDQLGISLNFKLSCETVAEYMLRTGSGDNDEHARKVYSLMHSLAALREEHIPMERSILLDESRLVSSDPVAAGVLSSILRQINADYNWHLMFLMLINLSHDDPEDTVVAYAEAWSRRIAVNRRLRSMDEPLRQAVAEQLGEILSHCGKVDVLYARSVSAIHRTLNDICPRILSQDDLPRELELLRNAVSGL